MQVHVAFLNSELQNFDIYPKEYLEHLAQKSTANQDLVELLWAGFVNGFVARKK